MSARACVCNFCIRILVDFGKNVIRFFWGLCFSFGASTSHFQGSISNARGTFEPKTPPSSPLTRQNLANNVPRGSKNGSNFFLPILSKGRFILLVKYQASKKQISKKISLSELKEVEIRICV